MPVRLRQIEDAEPLAIDYRPVASLIPYARNARTHSEAQVALIAGSIREYGFTNPVLVDGANGIIAGHGRVLAARKLGLASVPVIELAHLSEAQKRAYILADNRLAEQAGWDREMLALEVGDLAELGVDLGALGFEAARDRCAAQRNGAARPARGGDAGAARRACFSAGRPLAARPASAALRQRDRSCRRGAAARRRAAASDGDGSALWRELRPRPGATAQGRRRPGAPARS